MLTPPLVCVAGYKIALQETASDCLEQQFLHVEGVYWTAGKSRAEAHKNLLLSEPQLAAMPAETTPVAASRASMSREDIVVAGETVRDIAESE